MREILIPMLQEAFEAARAKGELSAAELPPIVIENPPNEDFGDYSTNLAMLLAKAERKAPLVIAERLKAHLKGEGILEEVKVERPGFLNFYLKTDFLAARLSGVLGNLKGYGRSRMGEGKSVHLEFVSANPTGPLHVGHGRGAAVGDCLARVLEATGHRVHREYYINDAGQQWLTAGRSAIIRKLQQEGVEIELPENHYPGDYISDIAASSTYTQKVFPKGGITLGALDDEELIKASATVTCGSILDQIRRDLEAFRVRFDEWYNEAALYEGENLVRQMLDQLLGAGKIYEKDGARWLKSTDFGDEKDRVVVREDGRPTYLASDIAYHHLKFQKNFDRYINIWGADHHGYLARVKASLAMLGHDSEKLHVLFIQFVNLKRGDQPVSMGKRSGDVVWLQDVVDEVGVDAARFFFLLRSADTTLEFDLELAKQQSSENPVYYVQYAHARVASLFRQAAEQGISAEGLDGVPPGSLHLPEEHRIARAVLEWPGVVRLAAERLEPHHLTFALISLAKQFHGYYNRHRVLGQEEAVTRARLALARVVQAVLAQGLDLLGVSAPEQM
ncbi:MAG: arginine--tRNA ligase [Candidatus Tectomicrobia bacterium]|uniref:Arginine--tRNA ligase n=1 Tax=Tectimicrobiota bacterium TaxID=2528274 RepID=A0A932MNV7_UNCTE|nr:arginine--tRNA ligase [Candidatus Tectomicrobia bacterium]